MQEKITRKVRAGSEPPTYSYRDPKQSEEIMSLRQIQDNFMALHQAEEDKFDILEYDRLARPIFVWSLGLVVGVAIWVKVLA